MTEDASKEKWCWSTDDENYYPADSREEAILEATEAASGTASRRAYIARARHPKHEDLVRGIGATVRERLSEAACEEAGEHGEDYPDGPENLEGDIERLIAMYLEENVPVPEFFQAFDVEEITVPEPTPPEICMYRARILNVSLVSLPAWKMTVEYIVEGSASGGASLTDKRIYQDYLGHSRLHFMQTVELLLATGVQYTARDGNIEFNTDHLVGKAVRIKGKRQAGLLTVESVA